MSRKKPTAADRPDFRRFMRGMIGALDIKPAEISSDMTILATRAANFDPADNVLWEDEANKSAIRTDVHCAQCQAVMVMSHHAYGRWKALDKKPNVVCLQCAEEHLGGLAKDPAKPAG